MIGKIKRKIIAKNVIFYFYYLQPRNVVYFARRRSGSYITNVQLPGFNKFFLGIDNKQSCAPPTQSAGKI